MYIYELKIERRDGVQISVPVKIKSFVNGKKIYLENNALPNKLGIDRFVHRFFLIDKVSASSNGNVEIFRYAKSISLNI
jgi:hypothetical protein